MVSCGGVLRTETIIRPHDSISFILGDDKPIPIEKRLPGIDGNVAKAVNGAIEKDVGKRLGVQDSIGLSDDHMNAIVPQFNNLAGDVAKIEDIAKQVNQAASQRKKGFLSRIFG